MNITSTRRDGATLSLQTPRCHVLSKAQGPAAETALQQEEALIQAAQRGDAGAFDALVKAHGSALFAYLKRLAGSHDDAAIGIEPRWDIQRQRRRRMPVHRVNERTPLSINALIDQREAFVSKAAH